MGFAKLLKTDFYRSSKNRHIIPFFFTFGNALLGFLSMVQAIEQNYTGALLCLMLAALMDLCDGRLARALGTQSALGTELDSLADAISFCVAPCILLYAWYPGTVGYSGLMALGAYVGAGIFRLARFNITESQDAHFVGLPTPIAAFFVISLICSPVRFMFYKRIPFIIIASLALLMVSSIPFPSFKKSPLQTKRFVQLCGALLWIFVLIAVYYGYPLLLMITTLYIAASVGRWLSMIKG